VRRDSEENLTDLEQKQSQLLSKLDEMKATRLQKIRAHIVALEHARDNELANLQISSGALQELSEISEKILQKHLRQSQKLLDESNTLRQRLEQNISTIVHEFERSARSDRSLLASSEVFVPAWYFQLSERPFWRKKIIGFACCYSAIRRDYTARDTFLNFFLTGKPGAFYQLDESPELETLVQADNMEYPAGEIEIPANTPDWLVTNNWVSAWLVKLNRLKK
jgi:hypothetical protein